MADPNVTYPLSAANPPSPAARNRRQPATSMAARCHSSPQPTSTTVPATTTQGDRTTRLSTSPAARITPGRSMDVSLTSTTQRTNLVIHPAHWPQPVQYWLAGSAHSCLVAQIDYQFAPIENPNGVIENPGNSDKLAQRNLQVTTSGNPGFPATHRVPQTIDVRPSPPAPILRPA